VLAIDEDGRNLGPTLFLVDRGPGVSIVDDPPFTHTFPVGHPTVRFDGVELPDSQRLGPVGAGDALTNEWFIEERVHIAARCVGAMERLLEIGTAWALEREQFGQRIMDFQGVSFPLADAACACLSMKLLTRHVAQFADAGGDPKLVHGKASMAKLAASEAAGRVADPIVQVLGGRGYMRTNPAERLWRELRVDRIWEGTSEIQRLVVARGLERRGVGAMLSI
jgi:acyl-CoA dehydrogenase